MIPFLLLILTAAPPVLDLPDQVDIIELNHVIDANGCESFRQWIFWEWSSTRKRYQVVAWRLAKPPHSLRDATLHFRDGDHSRRIIAREYRESVTIGDREVAEREWLAIEERRGLSR